MKNLKKSVIIALFCLVAANIYAQTPPNKVAIDSKDYYRHGYNKDGGPFDPGREERDSVTITSTMTYFVLPDPAISPSYNVTTSPKDFTNVNSTFTWTIENSFGTGTSTTPIIVINWTKTGIDTVKVKEVPKANGGACGGNDQEMPVVVIPKPVITFNQVGTPAAYADGACYTQAQVTAKVTYNFPVTATTSSSQVWVDFTVTKDGNPVSALAGNDVPVVSGTFPLEFDDYGKYEVTITKVTDRISRKSQVVGDITAAGAKFTYNVIRPAQTGPMYRIPNNY